MKWSEVRQAYPDRWLIVEALEAHNTGDRRELDRLAVVEECVDGVIAFQHYQALHLQYLEREFYFVHTSRENIDIIERRWLGVRPDHVELPQR
jgi:hypothetical protein